MYLLLLFVIPVVIWAIVKYIRLEKEVKPEKPETVQEEPRFKTIYTAASSIEANIVQSRLIEAGIQAFLYDDHIVFANPFLSNAVGGVKVKVLAEEYDNARVLLGDYIEPTGQCNFCHSRNTIRYSKSDEDLDSFINPLGGYENAYYCNDCGNSF